MTTARFTFECPHCQRSVTAWPELSGQKVSCAICNSWIVVPEPPRSKAAPPPPTRNADEPIPARRREPADDDAPRPSPQRRPSGSGRTSVISWLSLVFSSIALLLGIVALLYSWLHDPLGYGLKSYDFSTPQAALRSQMKIEMNQDIRAQIQLHSAKSQKRVREALDTMQIHREARYKGKTLLFVSLRQDGIKKQRIDAFEKDADTGLWSQTFVSSFEVESEDRFLAQQMREWEQQKGDGLDPFGPVPTRPAPPPPPRDFP
jgi:hypothetical protein